MRVALGHQGSGQTRGHGLELGVVGLGLHDAGQDVEAPPVGDGLGVGVHVHGVGGACHAGQGAAAGEGCRHGQKHKQGGCPDRTGEDSAADAHGRKAGGGSSMNVHRCGLRWYSRRVPGGASRTASRKALM